MPTITYIHPDDSLDTVDVDTGTSVMRAAIVHGIDGIIGECGGQAMCATCHVFISDSDGRLADRGEDEEEMLDCTAVERTERSRLGCQLRAGEHFENLTVLLPETQV